MALTYRYDETKTILQTKAVGTVTMAELVEYLKKVVADPDVGPRFAEIVDFQEVLDLQFFHPNSAA